MSMYEFWSESGNPGSMGCIDINTDHIAQRSVWVVMFKVFVATIMTAGLFWVPYHFLPIYFPITGWHVIGTPTILVLLYLGISFFVIPRPDTDNLGWMGGMANDPFKYTDDWNRSLVSLNHTLAPGRFIAGTILDVACMAGIVQSSPVPKDDEELFGVAHEASTDNAMFSINSEVDSQPVESDRPSPVDYESMPVISKARFTINDDE
ncbi:hypothetical protein GC197_01665 [bacterium]|nr:hypothetical protein [bacterium]